MDLLDDHPLDERVVPATFLHSLLECLNPRQSSLQPNLFDLLRLVVLLHPLSRALVKPLAFLANCPCALRVHLVQFCQQTY